MATINPTFIILAFFLGGPLVVCLFVRAASVLGAKLDQEEQKWAAEMSRLRLKEKKQ